MDIPYSRGILVPARGSTPNGRTLATCDNGYMVPGLTEEHETAIAAAWQDMVDEIADGALCRAVLADHGFSKTSVRRFRLAEPARVQAWREAIADSAVELNDEHLETARNTDMDPSRMRNKLNALEWQMAKRDPDRYADRSRHDVNVRTLDYTEVMQRALRRVAARAAGQVIDAEVLRPALAAMSSSSESSVESDS